MLNIRRAMAGQQTIISVHEDLRELAASMRNTRNQGSQSQRIFAWSGFGYKLPADFFDNNRWAQDFVGLFSDQEMWPWRFKLVGDEPDRSGNNELLEALGSLHRPIIAALRIRSFDSDDSFQGSQEWLHDIGPHLCSEHTGSKILIDQIAQSMADAKQVGINLFLEKISLIISDDPGSAITLTPHLHRDGAYGYLESSIVSFYSERITPHSSTLFVPDFDFEAASHLKPITAEVLKNHFPGTSVYSLGSGSLGIFSGKIANDGSKSDSRGALHISPEGFFPTCRLAFLFRSKLLL